MNFKILSRFQAAQAQLPIQVAESPPSPVVKPEPPLRLARLAMPHDELVKQRREICDACEFNVEGSMFPLSIKFRKCSQCGCPLASKLKLRASNCPEGKW